jgi:asparagine synthase (glutamine-hydrolysing)
VIPRLGSIYDEPFADSSQIPTYLVSDLARRDVIVSLSGDGGDEIFGGYDRYRWLPRTARRFQKVPALARRALAKSLLAVPPRAVDLAVRPLPARRRPRIPSVKLAKFVSIAQLDDPAAMYAELVTHWNEPDSLVVGARSVDTLVDHAEDWPQVGGLENLLMALDTRTYLPDDILVKLDRATMAVGLEARVPLLDYRVVEWAAALPPEAKIVDGQSKHLLRRILRDYVPDEVMDRPKTGFGVPLGEWLRGPLRGWAEELLAPSRLAGEGFLHAEPVQTMWREHQGRRRDWEFHLWDVLMFQSWQESTAAPIHIVASA